jgi:hypothetical protein
LSTIARVSGGIYNQLPELVSDWKKFSGPFYRFNEPLSVKEEKEIAEKYLTPMLLSGKPDSVDLRRWFIKSLSNDQTSFTGFTSLVDIVEDEQLGYDGNIKLLPLASFIEPFVLDKLDKRQRQKLFSIKERLDELDSTQIEEIDNILSETEKYSNLVDNRRKGKSPIFFYSVSDKPFKLSRLIYDKLVEVVKSAYSSLCVETNNENRNIFTGSADFMFSGDDIYLIDIGVPAVGYIADILATSQALNRKPDVGIDKIISTIDSEVQIPINQLSRELGFFKQERDYLVSELKRNGISVSDVNDESYEVFLNGVGLPNKRFDYLSRNQPLRNEIFSRNSVIKVPKGKVLQPDDFNLARFYEESRLGEEELGLLIKKKTFFSEYERGTGYFKPLVTPIWSREIRVNNRRSNLYEQFIPSLLDVDIQGDLRGKRCYEIRMYFVGDKLK